MSICFYSRASRKQTAPLDPSSLPSPKRQSYRLWSGTTHNAGGQTHRKDLLATPPPRPVRQRHLKLGPARPPAPPLVRAAALLRPPRAILNVTIFCACLALGAAKETPLPAQCRARPGTTPPPPTAHAASKATRTFDLAGAPPVVKRGGGRPPAPVYSRARFPRRAAPPRPARTSPYPPPRGGSPQTDRLRVHATP
jgi:hypothetical protein